MSVMILAEDDGDDGTVGVPGIVPRGVMLPQEPPPPARGTAPEAPVDRDDVTAGTGPDPASGGAPATAPAPASAPAPAPEPVPASVPGPGDTDADGGIDGMERFTAAVLAQVAVSMDALPDPSGPDTPMMLARYTTDALLAVGPSLTVSPVRVMGGWQGLVYMAPLLHRTLRPEVAAALDAGVARMGSVAAGMARSFGAVDLSVRGRLPWMPLTSAVALLTLDMAGYGAADVRRARVSLLSVSAQDGAPVATVCDKASAVVSAGLRNDTMTLWTLYVPEPGDVTSSTISAGVRQPLAESSYRSLMETHMRRMLQRQTDPEVARSLVDIRALLWKVWCDPERMLADSVYTVDQLVERDGPAPPELTEPARYMFGLASAMLTDGLDARAVVRVLKGVGE